MNVDLLQQARQEQRLSPQAIQLMSMLCFSFQELNSFIQEQFEINPALEFSVPIKSSSVSIEHIANSRDESDVSQWDIPECVSFQEQLKAQLDFCTHTIAQIKAAQLIIDSLEENGYLLISIESLAAASKIPAETLHAALSIVQSMDPPGIAARNVSECLALQLTAKGVKDPVLHAIIRNDLLLVAQRKYSAIAKNNCITAKQAEAYCDEIRSMRPYPCIDGGRVEYVVPDVTVLAGEDSLDIQWHDDNCPSLQLNPEFILPAAEAGEEERCYFKECLQNGRSVIHMLEMRRITMEKIVNCLVSVQRGFFLGYDTIKPLSYERVAELTDVHPSTVYRATQNKYLHCSKGTYPLRYFMQQAAGSSNVSKDAVKQIINGIVAETPGISDREISERLEERGVRVARRTVAKYRAELGLKPIRTSY